MYFFPIITLPPYSGPQLSSSPLIYPKRQLRWDIGGLFFLPSFLVSTLVECVWGMIIPAIHPVFNSPQGEAFPNPGHVLEGSPVSFLESPASWCHASFYQYHVPYHGYSHVDHNSGAGQECFVIAHYPVDKTNSGYVRQEIWSDKHEYRGKSTHLEFSNYPFGVGGLGSFQHAKMNSLSCKCYHGTTLWYECQEKRPGFSMTL
jgi:hypothetical protein